MANARQLDRGSPATNLGNAARPADKSQINRRPCFLPSTLGADTIKYNLQTRDVLTRFLLDFTDIRARLFHRIIVRA
jgi:hypothetical protein